MRVRAALVTLALAGPVVAPSPASARRSIPDTSAAIHVWNDQLPDTMTAAQIRFVARHVDGTQKPVDALPARIGALRTASGLYVRRFAHGVVVVNPGQAPAFYRLPGALHLVTPHGGGTLPENASTAGWGLRRHPVRGSVTLAPHTADVLLNGR